MPTTLVQPPEQTPAPTRRAATARWFAASAATGMAIAGAFHLGWAFSPWPLSTWQDWNATVMGTDDPAARVGSGWVAACFAIAGLLLAGAVIVGTRAGLFRRVGPWWVHRLGAWCVTLVLLARGLLGLVAADPTGLPFDDWNRFLYSPLCLALAAASAVAIRCAGRHPRGVDAAAGWLGPRRH